MKLIATLRQATAGLILRVRSGLLRAGLALIYWTGVAATRLCAAVLARRALAPKPPRADSFWEPAQGYQSDLESAQRQS